LGGEVVEVLGKRRCGAGKQGDHGKILPHAGRIMPVKLIAIFPLTVNVI
jgi:hypothetical protein